MESETQVNNEKELELEIEEIKKGKTPKNTDKQLSMLFNKVYRITKKGMKAIYNSKRKKDITPGQSVVMTEKLLNSMIQELKK